ncbi:MAG: hypothetical protein ACP5M8_07560, partial [Caldisphaera sp.]
MENRYEGKRISLDEAEKQVEEIRNANRFLTLRVGEKAKLSFTGRVYERHASGMKGEEAWEADKLDFELEEMAGEQHKLLSLSKGNKAVPELIRQLKAGNMKLVVG